MEDWFEVVASCDNVTAHMPYGVSAIAFDPLEELLWAGYQNGRVTSYSPSTLERYTSWMGHASEVRQIHSYEGGILTLSSQSIHCANRGGLVRFSTSTESMIDLQSVARVSPSQNTFLVGGLQPTLLVLDAVRGRVLKEVPFDDGAAILRRGRMMCCATPSGKIHLLDPISLKQEHTFEGHSGTISDMDVTGNLLVTCGFSNRNNMLVPDPFVKVYDIRVMKALPPLQFPSGAALLKFLPRFTSRLAMVSQMGQLQILDAQQGLSAGLLYRQISVNAPEAFVTSFDVSSSCNFLAFGDSSGLLHVWSSMEEAAVNTYSRESDVPDEVEPVLPLHVDDESMPLSVIPMPVDNGGHLLSHWRPLQTAVIRRPPVPVDKQILASMRLVDFVGYAPNPHGLRRNLVPYPKHTLALRKANQPGKRGGQRRTSFGRKKETKVPAQYLQVEIKYSRLGIEDFDFAQYNRTKFGGLEPHIPNAYCNAMLQALYFAAPMRVLSQSHVCAKEFCLTCEMGLLFHMLDGARGANCQASNFLRAFRTIPQASALGLVLPDDFAAAKANFPRLIQGFTRFVVQQVHTETVPSTVDAAPIEYSPFAGAPGYGSARDGATAGGPNKRGGKVAGAAGRGGGARTTSPVPSSGGASANEQQASKGGPSVAQQVFGAKVISRSRCVTCGFVSVRETDSFVFDLSYESVAAAAAKVQAQGGSAAPQQSSVTSRTEAMPVAPGSPNMGARGSPRLESTPVGITFGQLLSDSICREQSTKAWCEKCARYQPMVQSRGVHEMPPVLIINCAAERDADLQFWTQATVPPPPARNRGGPFNLPVPAAAGAQEDHDDRSVASDDFFSGDEFSTGGSPQLGPSQLQPNKFGGSVNNLPVPGGSSATQAHVHREWLPEAIRMWTEDERVVVADASCEDAEGSEASRGAVYDLLSTVAHVRDERSGGNLIAHVKVDPTYHDRLGSQSSGDGWFLFNDFLISETTSANARHFDTSWKVPCVLVYALRDISKNWNMPIKLPIDDRILMLENSLSRRKPGSAVAAKAHLAAPLTFTPLSSTELPQPGDIFGIDAEFVALNPEEAEIRSDGTRSTLKLAQLSVARVTVIRGHGPLEGTPFIDDYIATSEQVADYLTKFSGINPGDLDAAVSSKHLTSLKATYLKLRFLIDRGVKFVGHGLKKDFRVINILVPPEQIIDTVELFSLKRQRKISLRFLAWYLLGIDIQAVTHDSTEDARTALRLYNKYREYEQRGTFEAKLGEIYDAGRVYNWKAPHWT